MARNQIEELIKELKKEEIRIINFADSGINYLFRCSCNLYHNGKIKKETARLKCVNCNNIYELTPTTAKKIKNTRKYP